jgi:NADH-quinone oxidoreductase subunit J
MSVQLAADVLAAGGAGTGEAVTFWILGPLAVLAALAMVMARNAVHSALWLVLVMLCLGVFYVVQSGPFIGLAQIIVYTGAIMMLFLFVLMLVGRDASDSLIEILRGQRVAAVVVGLGFAGLVGTAFLRALRGADAVGLAEANAAGNVPGLAQFIFTRYILAFEATSGLLIAAAVGSMVLAHIERRGERRAGQPVPRRQGRPGRLRDVGLGGHPGPPARRPALRPHRVPDPAQA